MSETATIQQVFDEIKDIKKEVEFIKEHMFDFDTILSNEEMKRFEQSLKELRDGKTTSLSDLKKELGL